MRARWILIWVCLTGMLAVGCSSDPGHPTTLPSLTPTPSASPTPSTTDLEAATQVVRRYYSLLNAETSASNADALSGLMTSDCKCQEVARSTREIASKHEHYFGRTTVRAVRATPDSTSRIEVLVTYDYGQSGIADKEGHALKSFPGRREASANFSIIRSARAWLISAIVYVSNGQLA